MKKTYFNILSIWLMLSCNMESKTSESHVSIDHVEDSSELVYKTHSTDKLFPSGIYGNDFYIVHSKNKVCGYYFYFGGWDENFQEYTQICKFNFRSEKKINDSTFTILTSDFEKDGQEISGEIYFSQEKNGLSKVNILLESQPYGYADVNFIDSSGYNVLLSNKKDWENIGIIVKSKVFLYKSPNSNVKTKSYLIQGDVINILNCDTNGWLKIEYLKPYSNNGLIRYIKDEDASLLIR